MSSLSDKATQTLRQISDADMPCKGVNWGIADKLMTMRFVTVVRKPDPKSKCGKTRYYRITEKGSAELEDVES